MAPEHAGSFPSTLWSRLQPGGEAEGDALEVRDPAVRARVEALFREATRPLPEPVQQGIDAEMRARGEG